MPGTREVIVLEGIRLLGRLLGGLFNRDDDDKEKAATPDPNVPPQPRTDPNVPPATVQVHHEPAPVPAASSPIGIFVRQIYHDWFKDAAEGPGSEDTAATAGEIGLILAGTRPLPPGALILFGVDPDDCKDIVVSWTVEGPGVEGGFHTDSFAYSPLNDAPYEGRYGKIKPQMFDRNEGHRGILVTYPLPDGPNRGVLSITGRPGGGQKSEAQVVFPWVAKEKK